MHYSNIGFSIIWLFQVMVSMTSISITRKPLKLSFRDIITGTVTIMSGNTSAVIIHNIGSTNYKVNFESNADVVSHWYSNKNINDITVNIASPQFGINVDLDYELIKL